MLLLVSCNKSTAPFSDAEVQSFIYVSASGVDSHPGTREYPLKSLSKAMTLALAERRNTIKIASGEVSANSFYLVGGIDLIGNCDANTWQPNSTGKTTIRLRNGPVKGFGVNLATKITNLAFVAGDGIDLHPCSYALHLDHCSSLLKFENCSFVGAAGLNLPESEPDVDNPSPREAETGQSGHCSENNYPRGGFGGYVWFFDLKTTGGRGGHGSHELTPATDGESGTHENQTGESSSGGMAGADAAGDTLAQKGSDGASGAEGLDGANGTGYPGADYEFQGELFPRHGSSGSHGQPGQGGGGGGGGGRNSIGCGNAGGGGGQGGKSGGRGIGGHSGGHSFGIFCNNSDVGFTLCSFFSANGGNGSDGGNGMPGESGQPGAPGGTACLEEVGAGGDGGHGGPGGGGGAGCGGNGGNSFAVYLTGNKRPVIEKMVACIHGQHGNNGQGGYTADGLVQATNGLPGTSGPIFDNQPARKQK